MGKLIVFEGIDGSGKSTQFKMLCDRLQSEGKDFQRLVFPQYSEPSSALLRMYLAGEFGKDPSDVNAYAASTFYAVDRYASYVKVWRDYYQNGGLMLADRYTTSNAIHQGSKVSGKAREDFYKWLYDYEYGLLELPKPDKVIYMDIPVETAEKQMRLREAATNTKADIHELDIDYLRKCAQCGAEAAEHFGWHSVKCTESGEMRSIEEIHNEIYDYLKDGGLI
jgi:dTMP kinase